LSQFKVVPTAILRFNKQPPSFKNHSAQEGFSLIEVLVGLSILAIALMSGLKALNQTIQTQTAIQEQYLAMTSANNALNQIYLQKRWPEFGKKASSCSQLNLPLVCIQNSFSTPNPAFKRIEIEVFASTLTNPNEPQGKRLAKLTAIVFNYQAQDL